MRVVIQRTKKSCVKVNDLVTGSILNGLTVLVAFKVDDTSLEIDYVVKKIVNLRIFDDENGVMNKSLLEVGGSILSVSQFTLYGDTRKGRRPSYILSHRDALPLYNEFNQKLSEYVRVETGVFGADMQLELINDGPVTIIIDTDDIK